MLREKFLDIRNKQTEKLVITYKIRSICRIIPPITRKRRIARKILDIHLYLGSYLEKFCIIRWILTIAGKILDIMTELSVMLDLIRWLDVIDGNFPSNK
jgi:hypothetical protein